MLRLPRGIPSDATPLARMHAEGRLPCHSIRCRTSPRAPSLIDLRAEPMWRPGLEYASGMWQIAAGHAIRTCEAAALEGIDVSGISAWGNFEADKGRRALGQFWAALPDPLEGGQRIAQNSEASVIEPAMSQQILAETPRTGPTRAAGQALLAYARLAKLDEQLFQAINDWLAQHNAANDDLSQTSEIAALAASIASVQSNPELGEITAHFILDRAGRFHDWETAAGA